MSEAGRAPGAVLVVTKRALQGHAGVEALAEHARIASAFRVERLWLPRASQPCADPTSFREVACARPYDKDYDALPDGDPMDWPRRFDTRRWALLAAFRREVHVGGAVVAQGSAAEQLLDGRQDLALLWDLRVAKAARRTGVAGALWSAVEAFARERGCVELAVETQNVNVPACRFYAARGCVLRAAREGAYAALPDEIQLLWSKAL